jgi:hypothetical protein
LENNRLKEENIKIMKKYNKFKTQKGLCDNNDEEYSENTNTINDNDIIDSSDNINNYQETIHNLKSYIKNKDGTCTVGGKTYKSLYGSRKDVWEGIAFQTTGKLIKQELILGKNGKIISKTKSIQSFKINNFLKSCSSD